MSDAFGKVAIGPSAGGGGSSGVSSFNGRTGAVVPTSGDYTAAEVTNALDLSNQNPQALAASIHLVPNAAPYATAEIVLAGLQAAGTAGGLIGFTGPYPQNQSDYALVGIGADGNLYISNGIQTPAGIVIRPGGSGTGQSIFNPAGDITFGGHVNPNPTTPAITNPPVSGTVYQNTTGGPLYIWVPITYNPTAGAAATAAFAFGASSTPLTQFTESEAAGITSGNVKSTFLFIPNNWYYSVTVANAVIGTCAVIGQ